MKFVMVSMIVLLALLSDLRARSTHGEESGAQAKVAQRSRPQPPRKQPPSEATPNQTAPEQASRTRRVRRPKAFPKMGVSYKYWNERVEGKRGSATADIEMQFTGLSLHRSYNRYFSKSRWRRVYAGELVGGFVKGKGTTGIIGDGLKDQPWLSLTVAPALVRRISSAAEVGLGVPLGYRFIFWKLKDSNFSMEKGGSFSVGGELYLLNNISERSAIRVALAQHYMWETTVFSIGWEWRPLKFSRFF